MSSLINSGRNTNARLNPAKWPVCLRNIIGKLEEINTASEEEFLTLGENLQDFSLRANGLSEMSSGLVRQMAGSDIKAAIEGLKNICDRINDMNKISNSGRDALVAILERFCKIQAPLRSFENIVRRIHILCTLINVEIARLDNTEAGFGTLVERVKELSVNIETKSVKMISDLEKMTAFIHNNIEKIAGFGSRQQNQADRIIEKTIKNMTELTGRHEHSADLLKNITASWDGIYRNISEVIASLQFQDITRQRIEHVLIFTLNEPSFPDYFKLMEGFSDLINRDYLLIS